MPTYEPTRSGLKKFLRNIREGVTYYTIDECAQAWGVEHRYRTWTFEMRSPLGGWCVTGTSRHAENVLSTFGPVFDQPPAGVQPLFDRSSGASPDSRRAVPQMRQTAGTR